MLLPTAIATAALIIAPSLMTTQSYRGEDARGEDARRSSGVESLVDPPKPQRSTPTCRGFTAVLVGPGETYHGTDGDDVIFVSGSGARVYGEGGDDLICVSAPDDEDGSRIYGGPGDDIIVSTGSHLLMGDDGNDVLLANGGFNEAWGGAGDDFINGAGSTQLLGYGDGGNDIITGSPGDDWLGGYDGNDLIFGWDGDDHVYGMSGDDELRGGSGFDEIGGADGDDRCVDFAGPIHGANITDCEDVIITQGGGIGGLQTG